MKTYIFWDVDGCINTVRRGTPSQKLSGWKTWKQDTILGYRIWHSPDMVAAINSLSERDDIQSAWLTTWEDHAAKDLAPVLGIEGADTWPVLRRGLSYSNPWWKAAMLSEYLDTEQVDRFVWIDDDHDYYASYEWFEGENERWLKISPQSDVGLTRDQLDLAVDFIDRTLAPVVE